MSSIKGPGGPRAPSAPSDATPADPTQPTTGETFAEKVASVHATRAAEAVGEAAAVAPTTASVIASFGAGRIKWEAAVDALANIAMDRGGVPNAFRASVAERTRQLIERDPRVHAMLRDAGAKVPPRE